MSGTAIILIIVGVLLLLALFFGVFIMGVYNRLVTLRNRYENAFSQIDVQMKRRHDLIPNLVNVAKGYMEHEKETLEAVIQARNQALAASNAVGKDPSNQAAMRDLVQSESRLKGVLGRLMMIAESYPDLKANQNMMALQEELTSTENKVSFARQAFNDSVTEYNNAREQFPAVVVASSLGFREATLFEIVDEEERNAPSVNFDT